MKNVLFPIDRSSRLHDAGASAENGQRRAAVAVSQQLGGGVQGSTGADRSGNRIGAQHLLGGTLGTLAGLGLGLSPRVSRALMPLMTGLNGLPKLALGPLFIIWFGMGLSSKVLISALMVFFIFAFNLYTGVQSVDPALVGAVRLLGGTQGQILGKVIWPACLPWLLTSLRTGLGLSLSGAIVGEYLGSTRGMGWLLSAAGDVFNAQRVLCCVLILVILIILLDGVVRLLEARLLRWR